jgi:hypothetical protein
MIGRTEMESRRLRLDRWKMLSNELKVATEIEEISSRGELPYFNKIADELLKKDMKKTAVHTAINRLIDLGTIDAEWEQRPDNHSWVRRFRLSGETSEFIRGLNKTLYE